MNNDIIGLKFCNKLGQQYIVVEKTKEKATNGAFLYKVQFVKTGKYKIYSKQEIKSLACRDYFDPRIYGVGYIGNARPNDNRQVHTLWRNMLSRCYNVNCKDYANYGGAGITVCKRWHCFENFLNDYSKIDGFDEILFKNKKLHLDKDIKQENIPSNKKVYSMQTCTFVSSTENYKHRNTKNYSKKFIVSNAENEEFVVVGIVKFAEENNLNPYTICQRLKLNSQKPYKGFIFKNIS